MPLSREELKRRFNEFDKNGDGKLTVTELREHLSQLLRCQISQQAAQNVFDELDKDSDGYITVDEWLYSLEKKSLKDFGKEDIQRAFDAVDANKNGKLDKNELKAVLKKIKCQVTDADVDAMIKVADKDNDGQISIEEFTDLLFKYA